MNSTEDIELGVIEDFTNVKINETFVEVGEYSEETRTLIEVAKVGDWWGIDDLLRKNNMIDINEYDNYGNTALHYAASVGSLPVVRSLLDNKASLTIKNKAGQTALHYSILSCAGKNQDSIVLELVTRGANVNSVDDNNKTALHYAAEGDSDNILVTLLNAGANIDMIDNKKNTPLILAQQMIPFREFRVTQLISRGASLEILDLRGINLLKLIVEENADSAAAVFVRLLPQKNFLQYLTEKEDGYLLEIIVNKEMKETLTAVLDRCVIPCDNTEGKFAIVQTKYLECHISKNGKMDRKRYSNYFLKSFTRFSLSSYMQHGTIKLLLERKLKRYGYWTYAATFSLYLLFLLCLMYSLVFAVSMPISLNIYHEATFGNILRIFCELYVFFYWIFDCVSEILQFVVKYKQLNKEWEETASRFRKILRSIKHYFYDINNAFDVAALISLFLLILLRVLQSSVQWIFAVVALFTNMIRFYQNVRVLPIFGPYYLILKYIVIEEVPKILFLIFSTLIFFSVGFFVSLRIPYTVKGFLNSSFNENKIITKGVDNTVWWVFLIGIREILQGGGVTGANYTYMYYNWAAVIVYMSFVFFMVVIFLNLFIAQLSDKYTIVKEKAEIYCNYFQMEYLLNLQDASPITVCFNIRKHAVIDEIRLTQSEFISYYGVRTIERLHRGISNEDNLEALVQETQLQNRCRANKL